ncbi:MAG TPA: hypothetical protein VIM11_09960 [Tepidisphaeraceae bacterium]|jgi:hypothetical protein
MNWAAILSKLTGTVDQHLVNRNAYLIAENRILRGRVQDRIRFTDPERIELAITGKLLGQAMLTEIATLITPDTILRWHRKLVEKKNPRPPAGSRQSGTAANQFGGR